MSTERGGATVRLESEQTSELKYINKTRGFNSNQSVLYCVLYRYSTVL